MKTLISKSLMLCFFIVTVCAQNKSNITGKDVIDIPFTMDRNLILIKASINNQTENNYVFDTGAQGVTLSKTMVTQHNLTGKGVTKFGSPNDPVGVDVKNIDIPVFNVNGFTGKNVQSIEVEDQNIFTPNAVGIIGISFFNGNMVTIDYKASKLIISKGSLKVRDKKVFKIDVYPFIETGIKVNNQPLVAHIDSGGPEALSFPLEWKDKLKFKSEPVLFGKARVVSGEIDIYKAQLDETIQIGSIVLTDPKITMVSGGFQAINIGFKFLKEYVITIDMVNGLMKITPNKS
jgi:gag-polyprotein putative aspartyl protease